MTFTSLPSFSEIRTRDRTPRAQGVRKEVAFKSPGVRSFYQFIMGDGKVRSWLLRMIKDYRAVPDRKFATNTVEDFCHHLDLQLEIAPPFCAEDFYQSVPYFYYFMQFHQCSPHSVELFKNSGVNSHLRNILEEYKQFLLSEKSLSTLHAGKGGWLSEEADKLINFSDYEMDLSKKHGGFKSWNAFFSRDVKPGKRPIDAPEDNSIAISLSDSVPYKVACNIKEWDCFWIKNAPYSVNDLIGPSKYHKEFVDGTIVQFFLDTFHYHGWHSPVAGTIEEYFYVPGFSFAIFEHNMDYLKHLTGYCHIYPRIVVIISYVTNSGKQGKLAMIMVGMGDVSSCLLYPEIKVGSKIPKGQKMGTFQFGGSTCCILFQKDAIAELLLSHEPKSKGLASSDGYKPVKANQAIARLN